MSNKLAKAEQPSAERKKHLQSFVTDTGYRLHYRHLPPETLPRLEAAARVALASEKPAIPTQRLETAPGEFRDIENPHDADYQEALEDWTAKVQTEQGMRFLTLCERYALVYEVDTEEVAAFRAIHAAIGVDLGDVTDDQVFLWQIVFPRPESQLDLIAKLFGGLTEEAIQAQKASFLSQLQRPAVAAGAGAAAA